MTPEERAEKICEIFRKKHAEDKGCACKEVAAEMEAYASERVAVSQAVDSACKKCRRAFAFYCAECFEGEKCAAVEEAEKALDERWERLNDETIKEAIQEAYEDAAKIAESEATLGHDGDSNQECCGGEQAAADAIRARARALNGTEGDKGSKETK